MNICTGVVTGYGKPERTEALTEISAEVLWCSKHFRTVRSKGCEHDFQFAFIFLRSTASAVGIHLGRFATSHVLLREVWPVHLVYNSRRSLSRTPAPNRS